jgi:hypothetical protein
MCRSCRPPFRPCALPWKVRSRAACRSWSIARTGWTCRVATPVPEEAHERVEGLWLVLVTDGKEVLIGELLTENQARASWTGSPLFVFVAEHHLRTDLYLPRVLSLLGDRALELIQEEDRELFACAFESRIEC